MVDLDQTGTKWGVVTPDKAKNTVFFFLISK